MDKDRDISRSVTTITPKKVGFVGGAVLAGSALLAACGGGAKSAVTPEGGVKGEAAQPGGGSSPIVVKTEAMPSATAKVEIPTATEVIVQKKLSEAVFKPTTFDEVTASIDAAYAQNPGNLSVPRAQLDTNIALCQFGGPEHAGNPKFIASDKQIGCTNLIVRLHSLQAETGSGAFFDAEVNVADYFLTILPGNKPSFDQALERFIGDTSPALN